MRVASMYDRDRDARRRLLIDMLDAARAAVVAGVIPDHAQAVLAIAWADTDGVHVRPYCAQVDIVSALGVIELAKLELHDPAGDK